MELIGNDLFATKQNFAFSLDHMEVLMALYQPLLSKQAMNLYYTLLARPNRCQIFEMHHTLCEKMQLRIDEVEQARIELEQFLLLRTMIVRKEKTNIYYYILQMPKTFAQFLKHDLFSRLLITKVGAPYIRKLIEAQANEDEWKEMQEITCHMKLDFSSWTYEKEDQFNALVNDFVEDEKEDPYVKYDILSYLRANDAMGFLVPHQEFQPNDISYINYCGQTYDIAHDEMLRMLKTHYHRASKVLNREGLQQSCIHSLRRRKGVVPSEATSVNPTNTIQSSTQPNANVILHADPLAKYRLSSVDFVHALIPNMILSQSEAESFPRLQAEYKFSNEVFNVLLEFVWMKSKNFNFKFLDKICAVWARANINTLEKALAQLKEPVPVSSSPAVPQPKPRKNPRIVETMPTYSETSNQEIDIDYDELSSLLQSLEQKRQSWNKS